MSTNIRVLTVCLGNICRSPLAEVLVERACVQHGVQVELDSAGTGSWHVGALADPRSRQVALKHGIQLTHRARQLRPQDFEDFDYILLMDKHNLADALKLQPVGSRAQLALIRNFDPNSHGLEVPDPYYGGDRGFDEVWEMLEQAAQGFAQHLSQHLPKR